MSASLLVYCRFCAEKKPSPDVTYLKSTFRNEIVEKLSFFNINWIDLLAEDLPETICSVCYQSLNMSYEFFAKVKISQAVLTNLITNSLKLETCDDDASDHSYEDAPANIKEETIMIDFEIAEKREVNASFTDFSTENQPALTISVPPKDIKSETSWKVYPWICGQCCAKFDNIKLLRDHGKEAHGSCNSFRCADCNANIDNFNMFVDHVRRHRESLNIDSDDGECFTSPDIEMAIEVNKKLSEKSKKIYEKRYQHLMNWQKSKKITSFSESVMLAYFQELEKKAKSSTLWTTFSMLKSTLSINHQIDMSSYTKVLAFLKHKSKGFEGKKSKTFSTDEINKFLNEAPDEQYLSIKIALIFGIMGACRRQELHNIQFKDVEVFDSTILVNIANTKTKTDRSFTLTGRYYELCKQYIDLRPDPCCNLNFFLNYKSGKCFTQNVGINKFGNLGKAIAKYLCLPNPELYTGHCFRRTSATLVDAGRDINTLKRHGVWKSTAVAEGRKIIREN